MLRSIFSALQSGHRPWQLAFAVVLGMFLGLIPFNWGVGGSLWLLILCLNVNIALVLVSSGLCHFAYGFLLDYFDYLGIFLLLDVPFLQPLWIRFSELPMLPYTRFNHSITLGAFVVALGAAPFVFFASRRFVIHYRRSIKEKIESFWLYKALMYSKPVQWFDRITS